MPVSDATLLELLLLTQSMARLDSALPVMDPSHSDFILFLRSLGRLGLTFLTFGMS